jgi:hypothetical protein
MATALTGVRARDMQRIAGPLRWLATLAVPLIALSSGAQPSLEERRAEVFAAERAFARSMADRDFTAFGPYVAEDSVFFSGSTPLRGREAVLAAWKPFFDPPTAPFSWEPDQVEGARVE